MTVSESNPPNLVPNDVRAESCTAPRKTEVRKDGKNDVSGARRTYGERRELGLAPWVHKWSTDIRVPQKRAEQKIEIDPAELAAYLKETGKAIGSTDLTFVEGLLTQLVKSSRKVGKITTRKTGS